MGDMGDMGDDAGVAQFGQKLCFAEEALRFAMTARAGMQELERDGVAAVAISSAVDSAHATGAGGALDLEAIGKEAARRKL